VSFCTDFLADDSERVVPGVFGQFNLLEEMGWGVFLVANFEGAETGVFGGSALLEEGGQNGLAC
jgi:hypothetical protein